MPVLFVVASVGVLLYAFLRSKQGAENTGEPIVIDTDAKVDDKGNTLSSQVQGAISDAGTRKKQDVGLITTGAGVGTSIVPGVGTIVGTVAATAVVTIRGILDPAKQWKDYRWGKYGIPFLPAKVDSKHVTLTVPGPYDGGNAFKAISIKFPIQYVIQKIANGDRLAFNRMKAAGMLSWRIGEHSSPFNQLLYETAPHLKSAPPYYPNAGSKIWEGRPDIDDEAEVHEVIAAIAWLNYRRHIYPTDDRALEGIGFDRINTGGSQYQYAWLEQVCSAMGFSKNKILETARALSDYKKYSMGSRYEYYRSSEAAKDFSETIRRRGRGFPGAYRPLSFDAKNGGLFEVWLPINVPLTDRGVPDVTKLDPSPEPVTIHTREFRSIFGSHQGVWDALSQGKVAWSYYGLSAEVAKRWEDLFPYLYVMKQSRYLFSMLATPLGKPIKSAFADIPTIKRKP